MFGVLAHVEAEGFARERAAHVRCAEIMRGRIPLLESTYCAAGGFVGEARVATRVVNASLYEIRDRPEQRAGRDEQARLGQIRKCFVRFAAENL